MEDENSEIKVAKIFTYDIVAEPPIPDAYLIYEDNKWVWKNKCLDRKRKIDDLLKEKED